MKFYISLLALVTSSLASAASLTPKGGVDLLYIEGVKVEAKRERADINLGANQIVVRYSKLLDDTNGDRVFDSAPFVLSVNVPESDLTIKAPKAYNYDYARNHFETNPEWEITTLDGKKVSYIQEKLDRGEGMFPYSDLSNLIAKHNEKRGVVVGTQAAIADKATVATATVTKVKASGEKEVVKVNTSNLEQLQAWYLKASKAERKEFRRWMIDQE